MKFQELHVFYDTGAKRHAVGTIAISGRRVIFEYESGWSRLGLELAPFQLPTSRASFQFDQPSLQGNLPGLFADSLPDGWGLLIMDRFFAKKNVARERITPLDRLAYLGEHAMGALAYQPSTNSDGTIEAVDIGGTAREACKIFSGDLEDVSRLLSKIGGSPGGARPKALVGISPCGTKFVSGSGTLPEGYTHWLMKFSSPVYGKLSELGPYEGAVEFAYLKMARSAGIVVPEHMLVSADTLNHLALRRFDRPSHNRRVHVATACGLLHADHRLPSLDYHDLIKLAWALTGDSRHVVQQYRRALFNFFAVNRDDHAKNHGYILGDDGKWHLSPAYDLTYSPGPNGEHWTAFLGEGRTPTRKGLLNLAEKGSISEKDAVGIINEVIDAVAGFSKFSKDFGIPAKVVRHLVSEHERTRKLVMTS